MSRSGVRVVFVVYMSTVCIGCAYVISEKTYAKKTTSQEIIRREEIQVFAVRG